MDREETQRLADEGFAELEDGNYDRVLEIADELEARRYPANFELRGRALAALDRTDEAIEVLQDGVAKAPAATSIWHWLGTYLSDQGRYDEAISAFESEAMNGGVPSQVKLNKAIVHSRRGDHEKALSLLSERPEFEPELLAWISYRADILLQLGRLDDALKESEEAIQLAFADADEEMMSLANRTHICALNALGRTDEAELEALAHVRSNTASSKANELLRRLRGRSAVGLRCLSLLVHGETRDSKSQGGFAGYVVLGATEEEALESIREIEGAVLKSETLTIDSVEDLTDDPDRPEYTYAGVVWRHTVYHTYKESDEPT